MAVKKTHEEFLREVYDLVGDEYTVLGKYVNNNTKILMRHNICGTEYSVLAKNFTINHSRCSKCSLIERSNKITHKLDTKFRQDVYDLVGDEYTVLGNYKDNNTKILMRHNTCGYEYEVPPVYFKCKSRCPKCSKGIGKFKQDVYDLVGDEYTVLGEYIDCSTKILMKHNICGYEFNPTPSNFKRGSRCPKCSGNIRHTTKSFKQEVYDLVGDEYTVLGEYMDCVTPIKMKHNKCGYDEWYPRPSNFKRGARCVKCAGLLKDTTSSFKQKVYDLVGDEYTVLGEYINVRTPIKMKHNKCGYEFKMLPIVFKKGSRCPWCSGKLKKTTEQFKQEVFDLVGDEYTVLGEYISGKTVVKIKHNICNFDFDVKPNNFLGGTRCPKCNESKGERIISDVLEKMNIQYIREKKFKDCKHIRSLRFDFYIESLNLCIEYDGQQHFEDVPIFKNSLEYIKLKDELKNNYCKEHNIILKRFSYKDFKNLGTLVTKYIEDLKEKKHKSCLAELDTSNSFNCQYVS